MLTSMQIAGIYTRWQFCPVKMTIRNAVGSRN